VLGTTGDLTDAGQTQWVGWTDEAMYVVIGLTVGMNEIVVTTVVGTTIVGTLWDGVGTYATVVITGVAISATTGTVTVCTVIGLATVVTTVVGTTIVGTLWDGVGTYETVVITGVAISATIGIVGTAVIIVVGTAVVGVGTSTTVAEWIGVTTIVGIVVRWTLIVWTVGVGIL
jgi:hypothetical protein